MSKHTPGPWTYKPFSWNDKSINLQEPYMKVFIGSNGQGFAHTVGLNLAEDEANARLIAAAPELLEVCKRVSDEIGSADYHSGISLACVNQIVAAIAKAEGR